MVVEFGGGRRPPVAIDEGGEIGDNADETVATTASASASSSSSSS
eukprot:CAMPEP_0172575894 /NCGR_PEP_ID=MMETSP1067-20121228/137445_1 /TAXON_ID=265564 ORGANISM="Thalassiosira punctigera, Strain Tpunct2005C2" /NCGR_SAMPLE_ID=MMETSP1067 /ASSEMBLY_ACC=CAM_ASM_000444 /LENGTH=44 /DNA_ID= /DNA_START= /DNA_END= /DNA_ORIENTATION=